MLRLLSGSPVAVTHLLAVHPPTTATTSCNLLAVPYSNFSQVNGFRSATSKVLPEPPDQPVPLVLLVQPDQLETLVPPETQALLVLLALPVRPVLTPPLLVQLVRQVLPDLLERLDLQDQPAIPVLVDLLAQQVLLVLPVRQVLLAQIPRFLVLPDLQVRLDQQDPLALTQLFLVLPVLQGLPVQQGLLVLIQPFLDPPDQLVLPGLLVRLARLVQLV